MWRWYGYLAAGLAGTVTLGPFLVLVLLGAGSCEWLLARRGAMGVVLALCGAGISGG